MDKTISPQITRHVARHIIKQACQYFIPLSDDSKFLIVNALCFLERYGILHRDIKLDNFLVVSTDVPIDQVQIKLMDFGESAICDEVGNHTDNIRRRGMDRERTEISGESMLLYFKGINLLKNF